MTHIQLQRYLLNQSQHQFHEAMNQPVKEAMLQFSYRADSLNLSQLIWLFIWLDSTNARHEMDKHLIAFLTAKYQSLFIKHLKQPSDFMFMMRVLDFLVKHHHHYAAQSIFNQAKASILEAPELSYLFWHNLQQDNLCAKLMIHIDERFKADWIENLTEQVYDKKKKNIFQRFWSWLTGSEQKEKNKIKRDIQNEIALREAEGSYSKKSFKESKVMAEKKEVVFSASADFAEEKKLTCHSATTILTQLQNECATPDLNTSLISTSTPDFAEIATPNLEDSRATPDLHSPRTKPRFVVNLLHRFEGQDTCTTILLNNLPQEMQQKMEIYAQATDDLEAQMDALNKKAQEQNDCFEELTSTPNTLFSSPLATRRDAFDTPEDLSTPPSPMKK